MSGYTPSEEEMREYVANGGEYRPWETPDAAEEAARVAAFNRFLADDRRKTAEPLLARVATLEAQVAAVRELHAETTCEEDCCGSSPCCTECGPGWEWPCPTIEALDSAATS